jgi:pimeloyl-ACP methyl ester carboxylesterase
MENVRLHGSPPYSVAVIHGGPGAAGEMAPVAKGLSTSCGILEPYQTSNTIDGLLIELKNQITRFGQKPVILIGYSWGAWLSFIFSAVYPSLVKKLIIIGSGPFVEKYTVEIMNTRLERLSLEEKRLIFDLMDQLGSTTEHESDHLLAKFGEIISKADSFELDV